MKLNNWLAKNRFKSLLIAVSIILTQIISWGILFSLVASRNESFNSSSFANSLTVIWMLFPLLSIFGLWAGFAYQKQNGRNFFAIIGMILNGLWLLVFMFIYVMVFVVGVAA